MRVAVVGGGIQGCAVALELAARDVDVVLFERRDQILAGASRHTEGKIHLGFVYAADPSLRTARLMARGAAVFAPALRRWLGPEADGLLVSAPFHYAVHRASMVTPDDLEATYARITAVIRQVIPEGAYFGVADPGRVERLGAGDAAGFGPDAAAVFATEELAVDPDSVADGLGRAVRDHPAIAVRTRTRIGTVDAVSRRLGLTDGEETAPFDHVVNCAWEGRLALDASAGLAVPQRHSFRMKYFGRAALAGAPPPPSTTIVLGPFGDVVAYPGGEMYCSWYPESRLGWSSSRVPPDWPSTVNGDQGVRLNAGIAAGLGPVVPAAARLLRAAPEAVAVRGGVIYARGDTDVDDAASELHERHRVGPESHGAYHSVDTGKYTTAPLFATQLADRIAGPVHG